MTVIARIDPTGRVHGEPQHPPASRPEVLDRAVERDPVELATLAACVDVPVHRVPDHALRVVKASSEHLEVLQADHRRHAFVSCRTTFEAIVPFARLTHPPGWVPAPHR